MKLLPIILIISFIYYSISATTVDCEEDETKNPSSAKDCNEREVNLDEYCCYIKGTMRKKYVLNTVKGCIKMKKKNVDNGAITTFLEREKEYGNDYSLDCNSSYITIGFMIILFLLF